MAKIAVVFHSVCGNTYLMAKSFADYLKERGQDVTLYRVEDAAFPELSLRFPSSKEHREEIMALPTVHTGKELIGVDALFLGSPTYYGCVSAQMKAFMDSFCDIWVEAPFAGKYFGCFATSGSAVGGSELVMQVMNTFAQHMGMVNISVPCSVLPEQPAYGIAHYSGPMSDIRQNGETVKAIHSYLDYALKVIG